MRLRATVKVKYEEIAWEVGKKSGSRPISRVLSRTAIHLGCASPHTSSGLPGSECGPHSVAKARDALPYLALLRVGFTLPPRLPGARCALTAPFHPYPATRPAALPPKIGGLRRSLAYRGGASGRAVCFLWHFPWTRVPQALPGTLPYGARTFLCGGTNQRCAIQPTQRLPGRLPYRLVSMSTGEVASPGQALAYGGLVYGRTNTSTGIRR